MKKYFFILFLFFSSLFSETFNNVCFYKVFSDHIYLSVFNCTTQNANCSLDPSIPLLTFDNPAGTPQSFGLPYDTTGYTSNTSGDYGSSVSFSGGFYGSLSDFVSDSSCPTGFSYQGNCISTYYSCNSVVSSNPPPDQACPGPNSYTTVGNHCVYCPSDDTYENIAKCQCQGIGSDHTNQHHIMSVFVEDKGVLYEEFFTTCDDGTKFYTFVTQLNSYGNTTDFSFADENYTSDFNFSSFSNVNDYNFTSKDYTQNNDNNYTPLNTHDDSNNSVNLDPVLQSLSQMSLANHNDIKNLAYKQDITNTQLSQINSNIKSSSFQNHSDLSKINQNINDLKNIFNDPTQNFSFDDFSNFISDTKTKLSNLKSTFDNAKSIVSNGFTVPDLPAGQSPTFTLDFHGHNIDFNLCSSMSIFRPFVILFITIFGFILTIKVYILAFREF